MKKLFIGCFALCLLVSCGTSKKSNTKNEEKDKTEKPQVQKVQDDLEEM